MWAVSPTVKMFPEAPRSHLGVPWLANCFGLLSPASCQGRPWEWAVTVHERPGWGFWLPTYWPNPSIDGIMGANQVGGDLFVFQINKYLKNI